MGTAYLCLFLAWPLPGARTEGPGRSAATQSISLSNFPASLSVWRTGEDFELATRGLVAAIPGHRHSDDGGQMLRDMNVGRVFFVDKKYHPTPFISCPSSSHLLLAHALLLHCFFFSSLGKIRSLEEMAGGGARHLGLFKVSDTTGVEKARGGG